MLVRFLFYLLLLLLPTQLGRHFFFDFSFVSGIRSDYLAPTIYFTDVIILLIIGIELVLSIKYLVFSVREKRKLKLNGQWVLFLFLVSCFLFLNIFVAINKWAALYKLIKIIEFALLGYVIVKIKPHFLTVLKILSIGVFYSSAIAILQFILQKSVGGFLWFLGERTYYASTPGIAAISAAGKLILRPYATFPHPNVLGGFIAIIIPLLLFVLVNCRKQINKFIYLWFLLCLVLGSIALLLSFSRAAWFVATIGVILVLLERRKFMVSSWFKRNENFSLVIFYLIILTSIVLFLIFPVKIISEEGSWHERYNLILAAIKIISSKPFFGVGLNNFIIHLKPQVYTLSNLNIFQPVHNIYLLITAETGFLGLTFFLGVFLLVFRRSVDNFSVITIALIQLFFLGCFDHYIFTLQQGQLLVVLFVSLAFLPQNA